MNKTTNVPDCQNTFTLVYAIELFLVVRCTLATLTETLLAVTCHIQSDIELIDQK